MEDFQPKARPASFYDAIIYSLDHVAREFLKINIPLPFAIGGAFYFGNALNQGDAKGMLVGGLVTAVSSAISYYQYRQVEKCDEGLKRSMQTHTEQLPSLETRVIEGEYRFIDDRKQLPPTE
ncbi:MAG: hypothetical protein IH934_03055 [Nanoarchaeota archaeon]|nr:hypothetical protein [Nanoarchaeota archaeon]